MGIALCALLWLTAGAGTASDLPSRDWLEGVELLAHSVRDQTVVIRLADGERHLLRLGQQINDTYTLRLSLVHDRRIELRVTHPQVSDRQLRLWLDPASGRSQIVGSNPDPDEAPPETLQIQPPPGLRLPAGSR